MLFYGGKSLAFTVIIDRSLLRRNLYYASPGGLLIL